MVLKYLEINTCDEMNLAKNLFLLVKVIINELNTKFHAN